MKTIKIKTKNEIKRVGLCNGPHDYTQAGQSLIWARALSDTHTPGRDSYLAKKGEEFTIKKAHIHRA